MTKLSPTSDESHCPAASQAAGRAFRQTGPGHGARKTLSFSSVLINTSGNVAMITAASVIPLLALIGGGVDMGRAYMSRTQLQAACDAGVLAGRRAMSATGQYGTGEKAKAQKMFDFNFNAKGVDATGVTFTSSANAKGQVFGTANATIPTVVMFFFGFDDFTFKTECMAELQIANADVMFVLDTTGSMKGSKLTGLQDAVRDFHKTINTSVTDENTRIRYGFVPYSMAVNAKELVSSGAMSTAYFRDSAPYETREAYFNTPQYIANSPTTTTTYETYASNLSSTNCNNYGINKYPSSSGINPVTTGTAPATVTEKTYSFYSWTGGTSTSKPCTRKVVTKQTTYKTVYSFTNWRYKKSTLDASTYKTMASVSLGSVNTGSSFNSSTHSYADTAGYYTMPNLAKLNGSTLHNISTSSSKWNGCLEERDTVVASSFDPVPSGAYDLDIDLIPNSDETRWRAMWNDLVYQRDYQNYEDTTSNKSTAHSVCPSPMKLLTEVTLTGNPDDVPAWLESYVTALVATGNTYHDIGMIWGGRLMSSRGIFAANVNKDNKATSRHVLFMTDGKMEPYIWGYNSYGVEVNSTRIAPLNSDTDEVTKRHTARFLAACQAVKSQGITLWVIAFGTTLTDDLKTCSSDGRAYESTNSAELRNRFKYIASQVANLRLGK